MKATVSRLALTALLFPFFSVALLAQQNSSDKKVVITKRTVDADGSETTETIVKKGKAADNFDAEQYLRDNKNAATDVDIRIESGDDNVSYFDYEEGDQKARNYNFNWNEDWNQNWNKGWASGGCGDDPNRAFLGVEEDSDEDENEPGLVVQIVRNGAAAKAGLKTNDIILQLNDTKTDDWDDLSQFISNSKAGDKIKVTYLRNGKKSTAEATLTTRSEVNKMNCENKAEPRGFLGVSEIEDEDEDEPGVEVAITKGSGAEKAGLQRGDEILKLDDTEIRDWEDVTDFMADTKPGDKVKVTYRRGDKQSTAEATIGEQKTAADWAQNVNPVIFKQRDKEACLGVYSEAFGEGDAKGAKVDDFTSESAARDASMQTGDVILSVNGQRVQGHDELWDEIAKYKPGEKVSVAFTRDGQTKTIEATLKACKDKSSVVDIPDMARQFLTWNWNSEDSERFRQRQIITIRKGEGDAAKVNVPPSNQPASDRSLKLESFRAYPNPTQGQITVEFRGEAVPTVVNLLDIAGRQLFREELNGFNGEYNQQFDLSAYAKGTIVVQVVQGDKIFSEQLVVN